MKRACLTAGLSLLVALVSVEARAQTGIVRGRVLDDQGKAIEDAKIEMDYQGGVNRKNETKTNKKGEYTQVGLQPGVYRVTATKEGFQGGYVDIRIGLGEATYLPDLKLVSAAAARAAAAGGEDTEKANAELRQMAKDAQALAAAGKHDEAIAAFQALLTKNIAAPEEVHFRIGQLQAEKKDWAAAEASYLKVLELKPGHSGATIELANVYQLSGQKDKAAALMAQASAAGAGDANVQYSTGVLHINAGRQDEAEAAFKRAIAIDPNHAESYYHLGTIALNQNNIPEAIKMLEKYLAFNPTNTQNVATAQALIKALKPAK